MKADLPPCARILIEEFSKQGEQWNKESAAARLSELLDDNPGLCFCLELEGEIIGLLFCEKFSYVKGTYLWLSEFAITSEHQGEGHGLEALKFIDELAKKKGFNVLILAANEKEKAFSFYQKFGFEATNYRFMEKDV
ncbi:MAG: GNAT family N-acetyltransferase [Candidatus Diapherotrites archaeon]|uniref:GNAT family N-acetyltransferase n=1 Tax=Candidatus Iainarchaeum sp. TaxID=3101447 RepID=A0A938YQC5_9ARCH|nr:GNAT family N-acetyltransferase [Candidatus Diapherotrites archaeon]